MYLEVWCPDGPTRSPGFCFLIVVPLPSPTYLSIRLQKQSMRRSCRPSHHRLTGRCHRSSVHGFFLHSLIWPDGLGPIHVSFFQWNLSYTSAVSSCRLSLFCAWTALEILEKVGRAGGRECVLIHSLFSCLFTATFPTTGTASVCQARRRACGTGELNIAPTVRTCLRTAPTTRKKEKNPLLKPHDWPDRSLDQASPTPSPKVWPCLYSGFSLEFEAYQLIFNMAPVAVSLYWCVSAAGTWARRTSSPSPPRFTSIWNSDWSSSLSSTSG